MNKRTVEHIITWRHLALGTALALSGLGSSLAQTQVPAPAAEPPKAAAAEPADPASAPASAALLPAVRTSGQTQYLTGGVGQDESQVIKAESRHWPLALEFAVRAPQGRAQFAADVDVQIRNAAGQQVLKARSEGPFLLVKLAPGHYTVHATLASQSQQKPVQIEKDKPLRLLISWPPGNGQASPE
ncbi:MAG: carboxypeptidase-like regulatory domain-containing protein [Aquabacterium sp.]|jgi:hypothetical protein|uniref:carboxypeptidase-like regulatory domain-containing protein n=1 Tax=Aquabacterium sp. TaxID=1872578 RepID=UPI003BAE21C6